MRRRAAKVDDNQADVVTMFRSLGLSVALTHAAGEGFPDLVVGGMPRDMGALPTNVLVEVKDGSKPPSARKLTPAQYDFHGEWRGAIEIVETIDDVMRVYERYF